MRVFKSLGVAAILAFSGHGVGLRAQPAATPPNAVPGEFIVKYRRTASAGARGLARRPVAASPVAVLNRHAEEAGEDGAMELVRVAPGASRQAVLQRLRGHAAVEYAEPNWIYTHQAADPLFIQQWA